jgi:8-oxo-dGTP pyrophosphatase MutT (NUDIX family)
MARGGVQVIPRPQIWRPGPPAPWIGHELDVSVERIRLVFGGRVGERSPVEAHGLQRSAVLAPFFEIDDRTHVLVTRRAWDMRHHRGEVSFPGGGEEPDDGGDTVRTALRESQEEVGLDPTSVDVLGELDHLTTVSSDRSIVPVVGILPSRPTGLVAEEREVEAILEVPVDELLHPESYREERWGPLEIDHPVHFFEIEGDTIWGATAAMLRQFLLLMLDPTAPP